jgi:outer membrane protein assembly factor BamB
VGGVATVIGTTDDGRVRALSGRKGEAVWATTGLSLGVKASPCLVDRAGQTEDVVAGGADGAVVCLEAGTGRKRWVVLADAAVTVRPASDAASDQVFVVTAADQVLALNARAGTVLWRVTARQPVRSSPLFVAGRGPGEANVFVATRTTLMGIRDGRLVWETPLGDEIAEGAALAVANLGPGDRNGLIVGVSATGLFAVAPLTGKVEARVPVGATPGPVPAAGDVDGDGLSEVACATVDGEVVLVGLQGP